MADFRLDLKKLKNIKLTKEQQQYVVLGVLLLAGGVYGYWNLLMKPMAEEAERIQKELKTKKENLEQARKLRATWEEYMQRLARVQAASQYVNRRLPPKSEFSASPTRFVKLALEGGVTFAGYRAIETPAASQSEFEGFEKQLANVVLMGEFHKLGEFLSRLSGEDVVYNIGDVNLVGGNFEAQERFNITTSISVDLISYASLEGEKKP
jgi:Tfp pilus assembly protein PilO